MKFEDHYIVEAAIKEILAIRNDYTELNMGGVLGVTMRGTYQKEPVLDAVRPTMAQYLREQYALKTAFLEAQGVTEIPPLD